MPGWRGYVSAAIGIAARSTTGKSRCIRMHRNISTKISLIREFGRLEVMQIPSGIGPQFDPKNVYDAVVVGSGAAGGMAAHVLTSRGMKVLLLEAGKQLDTTKELKSMEWPYDQPRRGEMPPGYHALTPNEYNI